MDAGHMRTTRKIFVQLGNHVPSSVSLKDDAYEILPGRTAGACTPIVLEIAVVLATTF